VTTVGEPQTPAEIIRQRQKKNGFYTSLVPAATATRIQFSSSRLAPPPLTDAAAAARLLPNSETVVNYTYLSKNDASGGANKLVLFSFLPAATGHRRIYGSGEEGRSLGREGQDAEKATLSHHQIESTSPPQACLLVIKRACLRILARSSRGRRKVPKREMAHGT
jgi:hypothetical protein